MDGIKHPLSESKVSRLPPLAERMRPRRLEEVAGQNHLIGQGEVLDRALDTGQLPSMLFWGPPGVGKTTLARLLAEASGRECLALSAIQSGVKEIREALEKAKELTRAGQPAPVLLIDEIHRFHKGQQDALLGAVENGLVILIGATTENPSFEVNNALLSRCQVFTLESLGADDLRAMMHRALEEDVWLKDLDIQIEEDEAILRLSGGDGRKLYNILELLAQEAKAGQTLTVTNELTSRKVRQRLSQFDKDGEWHYDLISAFIKSVRGSDPNAAVYYLARMVEGGQDPNFIARRSLILAAEDIGLANPNALLLANACMDAVHRIGWPEARIPLAETTIYLACSPKSNAAYKAMEAALAEVRRSGDLPVPLHLRNAPTRLMKELGYGQEYRYSHDFPGHFAPQEYLPEGLAGSVFYQPAHNPAEEKYVHLLKSLWKGHYPY
ncbi:MAG: replication-associated recombination protein A [Saprospiraceae bacterium]|nr:replication-associated recombination protein A [Saprospiraceae bacterium]